MKLKSIAVALSAAALMLSSNVFAADFPTKAVSLVVPWPAGGGTDILMRIVADNASKRLGQPVVVVNQPGASGSIALRDVANGDRSGHTISMIATGFITEQYGSPNAPTLEEFKVLAFVGTDPTVIAAGPSSGFESLEDLVAKAKDEPGKLRNASPGGTSAVAVALIESLLGIKLTNVPYSGTAPVVQAVLSGETQTGTPSVTEIASQHQAGEAKILAVASSERHFMAPDVPTFKELGYPIVYGTMRAMVAPADVDPDAAKVLEKVLLETLSDPSFQQTAKDAGFSISPMPGAEATTFFQNLDKEIYPILLYGGLVKVRQK
ncbi:ABC transporter substrate-binding protein [Nitratireductor aestuarii]|uniref:ABC transporter substrate-binding protein n=1 Tax=Nitratireductor aestuarii TaxID=1735103 RepID=A0A916S3Z7_9HYPH|nr:tripartite tricarboxylate transporter substrate binding protein [Nitratireductor aestuarii]GGA82288.1 ABC transporter substrate-binding protein [Nitratireductor aestuarii]